VKWREIAAEKRRLGCRTAKKRKQRQPEGDCGDWNTFDYYYVINNHKRLPQQNGQHGNCLSSALAILMRTVAMEFG